MNISRRRFLSLLWSSTLFGLGGLSYARYIEPSWFDVNQEEIVPTILGKKNRLKILHLSDFHASEAVPYSYIDRGVCLGISLTLQKQNQ